MGRRLNVCVLAVLLLPAIWVSAARDAWPQSAPVAPESGATAAGATNSTASSVSAPSLSAVSSWVGFGGGSSTAAESGATAAGASHSAAQGASAPSLSAASSWVGFGGGSSTAGGEWGGDRQSFEASPSAWIAGARSFAGAQPAGIGGGGTGSMTVTGNSAGVAGRTLSNPLGGATQPVSGLQSPVGESSVSWIAGAQSFGFKAQPGGIWISRAPSSTETGNSAGVAGSTLSNPLNSMSEPAFGLLPPVGVLTPPLTAGWRQPATGPAALSGASSHGESFGGPMSHGLSLYPQSAGAQGAQHPVFGFGGSSAGTSQRGLGSSFVGNSSDNSSPLGGSGAGRSKSGLNGGLNNPFGNGDGR